MATGLTAMTTCRFVEECFATKIRTCLGKLLSRHDAHIYWCRNLQLYCYGKLDDRLELKILLDVARMSESTVRVGSAEFRRRVRGAELAERPVAALALHAGLFADYHYIPSGV